MKRSWKPCFSVIFVSFLLSSGASADDRWSATCKVGDTSQVLHIGEDASGSLTVMNVPLFSEAMFSLSTPIEPAGDSLEAFILYWRGTGSSGPSAFRVTAVLELKSPVDNEFTARLSVTDTRAKPFAYIHDLECMRP